MGSDRHQHPAPLVSEHIRMAPPRCRHNRVTDWMAANGVDALVAARADLVTWLAGYSRYYGGLSAVVIGRDGERVLVVPRDEVAVAEQLSDADRVTGYGERGFGLELNPAPLLLGAVSGLGMISSARRIGIGGEPTADFIPPTGGNTVPADAALHQLSLVKDADELAMIHHSYELCWVAQAAVADGAAAGATEIEIMTAAQTSAVFGPASRSAANSIGEPWVTWAALCAAVMISISVAPAAAPSATAACATQHSSYE